jgi:2-amino-4-hydroxy-6-hydroxymethyldihydropteridine diphosphokinase
MRDVAYVALGSNLGDRHAHLERALTAIAALPGSRVIASTPPEETSPIGPPQGEYLNQMVALETELEPIALLDELQRIENEGGRVRGERWGARTIDLDVVRFGARTIATDRLTVPHPQLPNRDFWQRALALLGAGT